MHHDAMLARLADAELVRMALDHDAEATGELHRRHVDNARTLVAMLARGRSDQAEIVAEAFRHTFYTARISADRRIDFLGVLSASIRAITGAGPIPPRREPDHPRTSRMRGLLLAVG